MHWGNHWLLCWIHLHTPFVLNVFERASLVMMWSYCSTVSQARLLRMSHAETVLPSIVFFAADYSPWCKCHNTVMISPDMPLSFWKLHERQKVSHPFLYLSFLVLRSSELNVLQKAHFRVPVVYGAYSTCASVWPVISCCVCIVWPTLWWLSVLIMCISGFRSLPLHVEDILALTIIQVAK